MRAEDAVASVCAAAPATTAAVAAECAAAPSPPPLEDVATLGSAIAARTSGKGTPAHGRSPRDRTHRPAPSSPLLSGEVRVTDGFTNFAIVFLFASLCWQGLHNYRQRGLVAEFGVAEFLMEDFWLMCLVWITSVAFSFSAVAVAVLHHRGTLGDVPAVLAYATAQAALFGANLSFLALGPLASPLMRGSLAMQMCVLSFKMHSYHMVNWYHALEWRERAAGAKGKDGAGAAGERAGSPGEAEAARQREWKDMYPSSEGYPSNLTLRDFARFLCLPTLVYDERFPLARRRRWGSVARAAFSALLVLATMYFLLVHHMLPVLAQASRTSLPLLILELSVPSMLFWIAAFFVVFHCGLNAWAELFRMADRDFYQDWWNATCMQEFWRKWNRPVYKWMCRHVYIESMITCRPFMTPPLAAVSTMIVTAFLHEVVLTCAIGMVRPWIFAIILVQVPYMYISSLLKGTKFGNAFVVAGMFIGMPLLWLLYAREVVMAWSPPPAA